MPSRDEEFEKECKKVRRMYLFERNAFEERVHFDFSKPFTTQRKYPQWDGGVDSSGRKHTDVWARIVRFARGSGIDPILLIQAVFASAPQTVAPTPIQISSAYGLRLYKNYVATADQLTAVTYKSQKQMIRNEIYRLTRAYPDMPERELWRQVIVSPGLSIGPLVRYVLSVNLGHADLAAKCQEEALKEYMRHPSQYDRIMGDELPQPFIKLARQRLQRIVS